jgi:hypothetical protein
MTDSRDGEQAEPPRDETTRSHRSHGEDALVFDIVVEPLLFGVVPMGSWYTGAVVVLSVVVGVVSARVLFKVASIWSQFIAYDSGSKFKDKTNLASKWLRWPTVAEPTQFAVVSQGVADLAGLRSLTAGTKFRSFHQVPA